MPAHVLVRHPAAYSAERTYALDVLLGELLGLTVTAKTDERVDTEIRLAGDDRAVVLRDGLFATRDADWLTAASLPKGPRPRLDGLPVIYGEPVPGGIDLLGSAFFLLTRYEEAVLDARDEHGRFPTSASLAAREGFLERPLVHEYADMLWNALEAQWPSLERPSRVSEVLPTHDVDWPLTADRTVGTTVRRAAGDTLRRAPGVALRRLRHHATRQPAHDPNNTFDWIMDASERRGLRSAFYFIAGRADPRDGDYSLDDPWIRGLLRRIHERGHEIGLHPSYTTFDDAERTRAEYGILRRVCAEEGIEQQRWGGRQHFLRWRNPDTWRNWEAAGLDYDSTLGFPDAVGFRAGICTEYPVFDLRARRRLALRERPLIVMDVGLERLGLDSETAAERLAALRETCRRHAGQYTLLWHNSRLVSGAERRLYEAALGVG
jgi:hypothetical protein